MSWCDMQAGLAMLWSSLWKQIYFKIEIKLMKSSTINDRYKKKTTEAHANTIILDLNIFKYKSIDLQTSFGDQ